MEDILPQEIVCEVLLFMFEPDIYRYGMTCKRANRSAELVWKKKLMDLYGGRVLFSWVTSDGFIQLEKNEIVEIKSHNWFTLYFKQKNYQTKELLREMMNEVDHVEYLANRKGTRIYSVAYTRNLRIKLLDDIYKMICVNREIFNSRKNMEIWKTMYNKLIEFSEDAPEYATMWDNHMQKLFPESFYSKQGEDLTKLFEC